MIKRQSSPTDVYVKLTRLVAVLRVEIPGCIVIVGSVFCRKRPRIFASQVSDSCLL
jgi:hypothetical protein